MYLLRLVAELKKWFKMNRIKEVLKEKGISQTWLADKTGKSYNTINEYARNKRQPSIEVLFTIAEILNMEAKELIEKRDLKDNK
jgi:putative transcriptional regulator